MAKPHVAFIALLALASACRTARTNEIPVSIVPLSPLDELLASHPALPLVGSPIPAARGTGSGPFHFYIGGHLYGQPGGGHERDPLQAEAFRSNVDELAATEPLTFISLGDFVRAFIPQCIGPALETFGKLGVPVYNAPGNHDIQRFRESYLEHFGTSYGGFRHGDNLFLLLDTELDPWNITGEQLEFLTRALELGTEAGIRNAFLFGHRVIFSSGDQRYISILAHCNSRAGLEGTSNYQEDVLPLLERFAKSGEVYWFAGDVGIRWSYGLFHDFDERHGIHYTATGFGGMPSDNVVRVDVSEQDEVSLTRLPLAEDMPALDDCGLDFWRARYAKKKKGKRN